MEPQVTNEKSGFSSVSSSSETAKLVNKAKNTKN